MCIILSLLSPEYAASQQAGATSIPEENVPQSGRKRKVATCTACGSFGHTKASNICPLKGNRAPISADPAATAVAAAAATAEPLHEDYLSDFDEGIDSDDFDGQLDPRYVEEENELYCDSSTSVDQSLEVNYTTQVVDLTNDAFINCQGNS